MGGLVRSEVVHSPYVLGGWEVGQRGIRWVVSYHLSGFFLSRKGGEFGRSIESINWISLFCTVVFVQ